MIYTTHCTRPTFFLFALPAAQKATSSPGSTIFSWFTQRVGSAYQADLLKDIYEGEGPHNGALCLWKQVPPDGYYSWRAIQERYHVYGCLWEAPLVKSVRHQGERQGLLACSATPLTQSSPGFRRERSSVQPLNNIYLAALSLRSLPRAGSRSHHLLGL